MVSFHQVGGGLNAPQAVALGLEDGDLTGWAFVQHSACGVDQPGDLHEPIVPYASSVTTPPTVNLPPLTWTTSG
jgi:hypothetical protein